MSTPHPTDKSKTTIILAAVLAVVAVVAIVLLSWNYLSDDSDAESSASTTTAEIISTQTVTVSSTVAQDDPPPGTLAETPEPTFTEDARADPAAPVDACAAATFQEAGHEFVDTVMFCDQGWARGGKFQTDYVRNFQWNNNSWEIVPAAGESINSGYPCYDTQAMSRAGAPDLMLMEVLDCADAQ